MRGIILLTSMMLVAGCKAQPDLSDKTTVPPERFYGFNQKSDAQIFVLHSTLADGCTIHLSIDGKPGAEIISGEKANFGVTIGSHDLLADYAEGCSSHGWRKVKLGVKAGDALIIDLSNVNTRHVAL